MQCYKKIYLYKDILFKDQLCFHLQTLARLFMDLIVNFPVNKFCLEVFSS